MGERSLTEFFRDNVAQKPGDNDLDTLGMDPCVPIQGSVSNEDNGQVTPKPLPKDQLFFDKY